MILPETDPSIPQDSALLVADAEGVDIIADIYDMHTKFGVHPIVESFDNTKLLAWLQFRLNFLQEELDEAQAALASLRDLQNTDGEETTEQALKAADDVVDAMIDLVVVAVGTLDGLQVDTDTAWARVHDANMQKEPGIKPERPNPLGLPDLIKPAGWVAPTHEDNIGILAQLVPGYPVAEDDFQP